MEREKLQKVRERERNSYKREGEGGGKGIKLLAPTINFLCFRNLTTVIHLFSTTTELVHFWLVACMNISFIIDIIDMIFWGFLQTMTHTYTHFNTSNAFGLSLCICASLFVYVCVWCTNVFTSSNNIIAKVSQALCCIIVSYYCCCYYCLQLVVIQLPLIIL